MTTTDSRRLNDLVERCTDDSRLFRIARADRADVVDDELLAFARRRSCFAEALAIVMRTTGATANAHGTLSGWLRRRRFDLRAALLGTKHLGDSLLACAEQGARTRERYRRALRLEWSVDVRTLLESQLTEIAETHERLLVLRGAT